MLIACQIPILLTQTRVTSVYLGSNIVGWVRSSIKTEIGTGEFNGGVFTSGDIPFAVFVCTGAWDNVDERIVSDHRIGDGKTLFLRGRVSWRKSISREIKTTYGV